MAAAALSSLALAAVAGVPTLLHRLRPPPPPSSSLFLFSKHPPRPPRLLFCRHSSLPSILHQEQEQEQEQGQQVVEIDSLDSDGKLETNEAARMNLDPATVLKRTRVDPVDLPALSVREKKELASYANGLGKKLKSQLVGKSGVTPSLAAAFVENLESNELLKVKIHGTCPEELDDTVKELERATGSTVVGRIGRTVILYRPSLTKLKIEEKKEQMRKIFLKRKKKYSRPTSVEFQKKGRPRMVARDSRGRPKV